MTSTCLLAGEPAADQEGQAPGQDLRDLALQLRFWLSLGTPFAVATVVSAQGPAVRRTGTVMALSRSGQTLGFNPAGCLDEAIKTLAAQVLSTGQDRLERLDIDADAASYIGLSGHVSLQVHITRVPAADTAFGNALRYLDTGDARVMITSIRGASGCAVVGAGHVTGSLGWPELPAPVIEDARRLLDTRRTAWRTYGPDGQRGGTGTQVYMQSYPPDVSAEPMRSRPCAKDLRGANECVLTIGSRPAGGTSGHCTQLVTCDQRSALPRSAPTEVIRR